MINSAEFQPVVYLMQQKIWQYKNFFHYVLLKKI